MAVILICIITYTNVFLHVIKVFFHFFANLKLKPLSFSYAHVCTHSFFEAGFTSYCPETHRPPLSVSWVLGLHNAPPFLILFSFLVRSPCREYIWIVSLSLHEYAVVAINIINDLNFLDIYYARKYNLEKLNKFSPHPQKSPSIKHRSLTPRPFTCF